MQLLLIFKIPLRKQLTVDSVLQTTPLCKINLKHLKNLKLYQMKYEFVKQYL